MSTCDTMLAHSERGTSNVTSISVVGVVTPDGVDINYVTDPNNNPKDFGNQLYVWESTSKDVPWTKTPINSVPIEKNDTTNTQTLDFAFEIGKGYIIGYAVGDSPNATCATIYIPAGKMDDPSSYKYQDLSIKVVNVSTGSIQVKYDGFLGYQAEKNKNWLGVWRADNVPYSGACMKPPQNITGQSSGYQTMQGLTLQIKSNYAVGYFMIPDNADDNGRTSLAASYTFRT